MPHEGEAPTLRRAARLEICEERLALSADPIGDFLLEDVLAEYADSQQPDEIREVQLTLTEAHEATGLSEVRDLYGFDGSGQTVAVIDSGIAYDHYALGGGFGEGYRVVGGWDFTEENDANPYDDGPRGFHGTHVAGIIGSDDSQHMGVASDVDLVALRVFNDQGAGYFHWIENALDWVHQHRNDFENPITTVNLSLGTTWNADSIPNWAMLEDEFAQLHQDGIFVAVSAGNSFATYNSTGLSYPAASPFVVPVASVGDNGAMSSFSQRNDRVIAAPGENIVSTVPDHVFGWDGVTDDFASLSGTSMAAPYVAGASVLVREAMEFAGYQNISQDTIYDHLRQTADQFYDPATAQTYHRLNLEAALDSLMPEDDFGSNAAAAHSLGNLADGQTISGVVGRTDDLDYFTFTADANGLVSLTAEGTHDLVVDWQFDGASVTEDGSLQFAVVQGQAYTFAVGTDQGIGYYDIDAAIEVTAPKAIDWGAVTLNHFRDVELAGESWFELTAVRNGILTVETTYATSAGDVTLEVYDSSDNLLASGDSTDLGQRLDVSATAGQRFTLKVSGSNDRADFRVTNLVSVFDGEAHVYGTAGDDVFAFVAGSTHHVTVNDVEYRFEASEVSDVHLHGEGGADVVQLTGTAGADVAHVRVGSAELSGSGYRASAEGIQTITVVGGGGADRAEMYDSAGDDVLTATPTTATLVGESFHNSVEGFSRVNVHATSGGDDVAKFFDSAGSDRFYGNYAQSGKSWLTGADFFNQASGFDRNEVHAVAGGNDLAYLWGSAGNDHYEGGPEGVEFRGDGFHQQLVGFDNVRAFAGGGFDTAVFHDTVGNDTIVMRQGNAYMHGGTFRQSAKGFQQVQAYATAGGIDHAVFHDSAGNDRFEATETYGTLSGGSFLFHAEGFDRVYALAYAGGMDVAYLHDSAGNDVLYSKASSTQLYGAGFSNITRGFDRVIAYATAGGNDAAYLYDSYGDDTLIATPEFVSFTGGGNYRLANGFSRVFAYAQNGGNDTARLYDSAGNDFFVRTASYSQLSGNGFLYRATGFDKTEAYSTGGYDMAYLSGVTDSDSLYGRGRLAALVSALNETEIEGFRHVTAATAAGHTGRDDVSAVDYIFQRNGAWE